MQIQSVVTNMGLVVVAAAAASGTAPAAVFPSSGVFPPGYNGTGIYTITTVWDSVTTYCPEPTTLCFNDRTYTIDKPTTLVIPDCPCTQTYTTQYTDGYKPTGYVVPNPPVQTAGATPAIPSQKPGGTASVVVTAGAEKRVAAGVALVAGIVAALAL